MLKRKTNHRLALPFFLLPAAVIAVYVLILIFTPSGIVESLKLYKPNNAEKFNNFVYSKLNLLVFAAVLAGLFLFLRYKYNFNFSSLKDKLLPVLEKILLFFTLKKFIYIVFLYLAAVFYISIKNFDLGYDEAWYLEYTKNFYNTFLTFCTHNGKPFLVDNITMLPMYLLSILNYLFGFTDVWHFKLLSSLVTIASLGIVSRVLYKFYDIKLSILFLILVVIQPGFSFTASSFFGEFAQSAFLFTGLYIWFKTEKNTLRDLIITSILFALAIQTKSQLMFVFFVSLVIFHFLDKNRRPLLVLLLTVSFVFILTALRTLPVLFNSEVSFVNVIGLYIGASTTSFQSNFFYIIDRLHLFNRFSSIILLFISLIFIIRYLRTELERFTYLFTVTAFLWWIFLLGHSTFRHLFMAIIPLCFLLAVSLQRFFSSEQSSVSRNPLFFRYISRIVLVIAVFFGFSINIFHAYIGYNDGVQFDLDGNKIISFIEPNHDDTQKRFYSEIKNHITPQDTLYIGSYVTKYYLPNLVLDRNMLEKNLKENNAQKYVLIGRDMFPLTLETGYKLLDDLNVKRELLLKNGSFELYKVYTGN